MHGVIARSGRQAPREAQSKWEASRVSSRSDPTSRQLPGACAQRRLYAAQSIIRSAVWPWQTAVKAVFLDRVDIVAHYEREVRSPTVALKLPSVIALKQYVKPVAISRLHPVQPVPARPLRLPILRRRATI